MVKYFRSRRDSQAVLSAQQKARGNGLPCHKHQEKPRSPPVVVQLVLVVGHYDYHPHKDSGPGSLQGSVKQDTLEPAPLEGVLQSGSPAGDTASERLGLGCCQVNGKCLEPLGSKGSVYTRVCNKPQCMRQYLPQDHWGTVGHMLHLCKNSNSGLEFPVLQDKYLGKVP